VGAGVDGEAVMNGAMVGLRRCVAYLMNADLDSVPNFAAECVGMTEEQAGVVSRDLLTSYLRPRCMYPLSLQLSDAEIPAFFDYLRGLYILGGWSPSLRRFHYVVGTARGSTHWDGLLREPLEPQDGCLVVILFVKLFP
jgi:hypothetical protein